MLRALLLTLVTFLCFNVQAQDLIDFRKTKSIEKKTIITSKKATLKHAAKKMIVKKSAITGNEVGESNGKLVLPSSQKSGAVGTDIGTTTYDLQSNSGMCRRIAVGGDGTVHAVWTRSTSGDIAAPDRGTGYNSSTDGGDTWGDAPTARVEGSVRTGWPNVGVTESGRVFSISHTGDAGMNFAYKDVDGEWTNKGVGAENGDVDGVWARVGNDGTAIHAVISRQSAFGGLTSGLAYFRSFDEGDTWDGPMELPLQGVVASITVDGYFVDVKGDVVVIGLGGYGNPVTVLKSTDKGDNFEVITVQGTNGYLGGTDPTTDPNGGFLAPTVLSGGSISVLLDNEGKLHVWHDKLLNFNDVGEEGPFYLADFCGIMYWNEDMDAPKLLGKSTRQDMDGDGIAELGADVEVQLYSTSNVSQVSSGVDADNNLYIAFSSVRDGAVDPSNAAFMYRNILMMKSTDGGATWEGPHNVTDDATTENVFPSIARTVTDKVHLVYQHDELAGTAVQPGHETYVENLIKYEGVPVGDIVTPELNNTEPIMTSAIFGTVPFALQNCEATIERFDAHAQDFPDGTMTDKIEISGVDITTAGEGVGEWLLSVTDSDENVATFDYIDTDDMPILIDVIEDTEVPLIVPKPYVVEGAADLIGWYSTAEAELFTLAGSDSVEVLKDSEYVDAGADIVDEGDVFGCPSTLTVNNPVNTAEVGVYEVTYNGVDANGKEAEPVVRVVTVISEDLTAPRLSLSNAGVEVMEGDTLNVEFEAGGTWAGLDVAAFDNVDGDISETVTTDGEVDLETVGIYTVEYTATDASSNSTSATIYVKVADTQAPVVNLAGPATVVWSCGTEFNEDNLGFTAFDNVDGNITDAVAKSYLDPSGAELVAMCVTQAGTYKIVYKVSDSAGNESEVTRSIIIPGPCDEGPCELATDTMTNVNDIYLNETIQLYPNPTTGMVNISLENINSSNVAIETYNVAGKLLNSFVQDNINHNVSIDLSEQATGLYMVKITTQEGSITKKVLVK